MEHGHFTADGRAYVVTKPHTPRPWHNYLVNDVYLVNLTQYGTGASFYQPTGEGLRVNVTEDREGDGGPRFVYLRDRDTGQFWSLTGAPDYVPMHGWQCEIGPGTQTMNAERHGIEGQWQVFVPPGRDAVELWRLTLTNRSDRVRRISVMPYLEMHLTGGSTLMDFIAVLHGHYEPDANAVFGINRCVGFPPVFKAFLAGDLAPAGVTVGKHAFVGSYRDYHNPLAVERGDVHAPTAGTEWLGASLRVELELQPGASQAFHCAVGVCESVETGKQMIGRYLADGAPQRVLDDLQARAESRSKRHAVSTGHAQFDRWTNVWLKHQLNFVARWGRVIGRGFRDILQDTLGHRLTDPQKARECLLEVFAKQFPSGRCIRAWRLPNGQLDLQHYADSPSWMIMALSAYLKETGDLGVLDEVVPFLNEEDPCAPSTEGATVWEHVVLAQRHLLADRGRHGLVRIRHGDWCDTMNGVGARGEGVSVMLSMQVKWGCDQLAELSRRRGEDTVANEMQQAADALDKAINENAWDGAWYLRAFDDEGRPVGSAETQPDDEGEGRIFINPQSWALISGVADAPRAASLRQAVREHLETEYGCPLLAPPFTGLRPRIGQMSAMTPGFYENGSVYVHGNAFWIFALARAGRGQEAWDAMWRILPDSPNKPGADTEPYTIPNMYFGPAAGHRTQENLYLSGWRTGSASWLYVIGLEWLLGVRAEYDGLRIDPCLPEGWRECRVTRAFRGATYQVTIRSSGAANARLKSLRLDGQDVEGNLLPLPDPEAVHTVEVEAQ